MQNFPLIASLVIHGLVIALTCVNFSGMRSPAQKDTGYAVFDYVEIGSKSKAPALSNKNDRLGKTQSQSNEAD
ncbi:MAG: hypothetical protein LBJ42_00870, partial [Holosporales bacterium]|nr:hypothetical protein [Holosporales bacterium]